MVTAVLVTGGTGTVGSRVAARLVADGVEARIAGRGTDPPFDWERRSTWPQAVAGVDAAFLLLPETARLPAHLLETAADAGVGRVVLLSDRSAALRRVENLLEAEETVRASGLEWTILQPDWFQEDFETFFREPVAGGELIVPVGERRQDFVSADDIGQVAAVALQGGYAGRALEVTAAESMTFAEAVSVIAGEIGRPVEFVGSAAAYREQHLGFGRPADEVEAEIAAFERLAAAGDVRLTSTVADVLGRPPVAFRDYVRAAAARGVWRRKA
jgi:uncharacterized protein YbjT (DUF2867 family)